MPAAEQSALDQMPFSLYGGKSEWAPLLASMLPRAQTFVMTHGGAGSPLWASEPYPVEVYNDLDYAVVNFFEVCRDHGEELARRVALTPYARTEFTDALNINQDFEAEPDRIEQARQYAYVARASHGGAWGRSWSRSKGHSRRGMSSSVSRYLHLPDTITQIAERLKTVQIECLDAIECIKQYDSSDTLFYLDPPYLPETRRGSKVYRAEMTKEQHADLLAALHNTKGKWAISGYESELYDNWAMRGAYNCFKINVKCRSNVTSDGTVSDKPTRTECLWTNYDIPPVQSEAA